MNNVSERVSGSDSNKPIDGVPLVSKEDVAARALVSAAEAAKEIGRSDRVLAVWVKERGLVPAGWQACPGGFKYLYDVEVLKRWLNQQGLPVVAIKRARRGDAAAVVDTPAVDTAASPPRVPAMSSLQQLAMPGRDIGASDVLEGGTLDTTKLLYLTVGRLADQLNRVPGENASAHEREKFAAAYGKMLSSVTELSDRQREEAKEAGDVVPIATAISVATECAQRIRTSSTRSVQAITEDVMSQIGMHLQQESLTQVRNMVRIAVERQFVVFMDEVAAAVEDAARLKPSLRVLASD